MERGVSGWLWNSEKMEVTLQERKRVLLLEDVRTSIGYAKERKRQRTKDLAALLGRLNFVRLQYPPASLWMKRMQYVLRQAIARGGWKGTEIANPMLLGELTHWRKILQENRPRSLKRRNRPAVLTTYASELGWGAALTIPRENKEEKIYVHGSWTPQEYALAINEKESRAVLRTLERKGAWLQQQKIDHIRLRTDNMSTRWTIQKKRGAPSPIPTLRALEKKQNNLDITIQTEHLPGEQNTEADALSRMAKKPDYALKGEKVSKILQTIAPRIPDTIFEQIALVPCGSTWRLSSLGGKREKETPENEIVLVHPFLRSIGRTLKEKMNEAQRELTILILPAWRGRTWTPLLQPGHLIKTLGTFQECMIPGAKMRMEGWKLPPGDVISIILETKISQEGTSSSHGENKLE
ncbi:uncharacterized protein MONOS_10805 [Monocercomonoides exilis]|uniref:uncharacterized protein n=1 Tax=Monocercomonoides exilis TaxID=2049356 RepID=UPI00355A089B|nr:hypothetical protein MONOS_10805 [Monocercomonoides exilis]|eukprot:MONOS_10805.1-p1 / transcript=MONOS_10805.1 / gene=MONOS_10805 / organism=Monocercomonoides_exilis_PA203 / gene_product=unspecified product / transcript_product=unspecified product / location=Mono_scaffold00506:19055-20281(-) / protein_length=409 / sequence_SO=supercontig / SO=protein_coding / is_pseudo=false